MLYSKTHEWVRIEGREAVIGISNFAQESLGDITYVELPDVGTVLQAGQEFGSIESVKAASDLYAPVNGEVIAVNEALADAPELVNSSAEQDGWLVRVKLADTPEGLLDEAAYKEHCAAEAH